jgi:hypothetical protein
MRPATISRSSGSDGTTSMTGSLRDRAETASADLKRYIKGSIGFKSEDRGVFHAPSLPA